MTNALLGPTSWVTFLFESRHVFPQSTINVVRPKISDLVASEAPFLEIRKRETGHEAWCIQTYLARKLLVDSRVADRRQFGE